METVVTDQLDTETSVPVLFSGSSEQAANLVHMALEDDGRFTFVGCAHDVDEVLIASAAERPGAIVLNDISRHGGDDFVLRLQESLPEIPLVSLTPEKTKQDIESECDALVLAELALSLPNTIAVLLDARK